MTTLNDYERQDQAQLWSEEQQQKAQFDDLIESEIRANRDLKEEIQKLLKTSPFLINMHKTYY